MYLKVQNDKVGIICNKVMSGRLKNFEILKKENFFLKG